MEKVISKDGTAIAFERSGAGPAVILVDGALCSRAVGPMPKLAPLLAGRFTVFMYDRRGRGDSGDTRPYAREREVEDIEALIRAAGGLAFVRGLSSGAGVGPTRFTAPPPSGATSRCRPRGLRPSPPPLSPSTVGRPTRGCKKQCGP